MVFVHISTDIGVRFRVGVRQTYVTMFFSLSGEDQHVLD